MKIPMLKIYYSFKATPTQCTCTCMYNYGGHLNINPKEDSTQDDEEGSNGYKQDKTMLASVDWTASWYPLL